MYYELIFYLMSKYRNSVEEAERGLWIF